MKHIHRYLFDPIGALLFFLMTPAGMAVVVLAIGLIFFWKLTVTLLVVGMMCED